MLVLHQWANRSHHRGRLSGKGRAMLRHRGSSEAALQGRNDADAYAIVYDNQAAGHADTHCYAEDSAEATLADANAWCECECDSTRKAFENATNNARRRIYEDHA